MAVDVFDNSIKQGELTKATANALLEISGMPAEDIMSPKLAPAQIAAVGYIMLFYGPRADLQSVKSVLSAAVTPNTGRDFPTREKTLMNTGLTSATFNQAMVDMPLNTSANQQRTRTPLDYMREHQQQGQGPFAPYGRQRRGVPFQ